MKKKLFKIVLGTLLAVMPLLSQNMKAQVPANCADVMLQGFAWDSYTASSWTALNTQAAEIGASFDMIWLPPSGNAMTAKTMGYLPVYWFNQSSSFGTQADLKTFIANLKTNNCKAIADIVINHRNGVSNWVNFPTETYSGTTYTPNLSWICNDDECKNNGYTPTGSGDTGMQYGSARDLDHTNSAVRAEIKAYLQFMKNDMGFAGWRYDMVKGYSGSYNAEYNDAAAAYFSVGEYWDSYGNITGWIDATSKKSAAFDFPFKYACNTAFNGNTYAGLCYAGQPSGLVGSTSYRQYAVTFVENHDTENAAGNPSPGNNLTNNIPAANAYMLASPGVPCVFFTHWNNYKTEIQKMIAARKATGVHSQSVVTNIQTDASIYVAKSIGTKGELIVKVGTGSYTPPSDFTLACSGTNYAMYTKIINTGALLNVAPAGGTYIGGTSVTLSSTGGVAPVKIYYTIDGTTPTAASNFYSSPINITVDGTVLKAITIDNSGVTTSVVTNTYLTIQPAGITIRFHAPADWSTVKIHAWTATGGLTGAWPGQTLTIDVEGFYAFTTPVINSGFNVVFNNGSGVQTVDITNITSSLCYQYGPLSGVKYTATVVACPVYTDLASTKEAHSAVVIYPNPAHETLTVEADLTITDVAIYSIYGSLVKSIQLNATSETISVSDLQPGFYSVVTTTENGQRTTSKLIKQ